MSAVKKEKKDNIRLWIISVGGSEMDNSTYSVIVRGTEKDLREYLYKLVSEDRDSAEDNAGEDVWEYGTESPENVDLNTYTNELYAYGCYNSFHIDYLARPYNGIVENLVNDNYDCRLILSAFLGI